MGYRIRILATMLDLPRSEELELAAVPGILTNEGNNSDSWEALILKHNDGPEIAFIEKNPVVPHELGGEELDEFIDEVRYYQPESAARWLQEYLPSVKVIYSFQFLSGTEQQNGFDLLQNVYSRIWKKAGGILQADGEGFSNEQGYTILWQFSDNVEGPWAVGTLGADGKWTNYRMELGNKEQREFFLRGEVPPGLDIVSATEAN